MKDLVFMLELIVMTSFSIIYCTGFDELQPVPQTNIIISGEQLEMEVGNIESGDNESGEEAEEIKPVEEVNAKEIKKQPTTQDIINSIDPSEWRTATATGYCACVKCCGNTKGITASGATVQANHTIAMSSKYDFGTVVEIEGLGTYTVEDRGSAIQGDRIDIYFPSHQEALNFGKRTVHFKIVANT